MNRIPTFFSTGLFSLIGGVFLALLVLLGVGIWKLSALNAEVSAIRATTQNDAANAVALQNAAAAAARTAAARSALAALIIPAGGDAAFISDVEALAERKHLDITVSSVTATPPAGETPGTLSLALDVTGSYANTERFLQLVETEGAAVSVSSVLLMRDDSGWHGSIALSALSFDAP